MARQRHNLSPPSPLLPHDPRPRLIATDELQLRDLAIHSTSGNSYQSIAAQVVHSRVVQSAAPPSALPVEGASSRVRDLNTTLDISYVILRDRIKSCLEQRRPTRLPQREPRSRPRVLRLQPYLPLRRPPRQPSLRRPPSTSSPISTSS
jgi:hypothetical protein